MQPSSWQKESEEIIVRRIVRRLDRFLAERERINAERALPESAPPAEFEADNDRTSTQLMGGTPSPEGVGKEVLSIRQEPAAPEPSPASSPKTPPPPPTLPKAEDVAPSLENALNEAQQVPRATEAVAPRPTPPPPPKPAVKEPPAQAREKDYPAKEQSRVGAKGPVQMIKMPPPPPPQKKRNRDPEAHESHFGDEPDADSRVDKLFAERREALMSSDRVATKAFLWALAAIVVLGLVFLFLMYP